MSEESVSRQAHTRSGGAPERLGSGYRDLRVTVVDGWATLTLARPEQRNAMSPRMLAELPVATAFLADQASIAGLVITGAGESFSVGGDLTTMHAELNDSEVDLTATSRMRIEYLHRAILNIRRMPFPVVAAVNGLAAGSGFGLALACDDRIASPGATFKAAYGAVGLTPDAGLTYLLPRIVGEARARVMILGDEAVRARPAERLGLVSQVVEEPELLQAALRRLKRLTRWSPQSIAATKHLLRNAWQDGLEDHLQCERDLFAEACATEDFRGAMEAFHAGGQPRFRRDQRHPC